MKLGIDVSLDVYENVSTDLAFAINEKIGDDPWFVCAQAWQEAFDFIDENGIDAAIEAVRGGV
jgi:ABC-type amino acid transport substrate-binding protein